MRDESLALAATRAPVGPLCWLASPSMDGAVPPCFPGMGGAIGAEQSAALLERGQGLKLELPFPGLAQGARWSPAQREALRELVGWTAFSEVHRPLYQAPGYFERNYRILDRADLLVVI